MADEQQPPEEQSMAKYRPRGLQPSSGGTRPPVEISFDPTTPDGAKKMIQGTLTKLPSVKSLINKTIGVVDILSHDAATFDAESGVTHHFRRSVIYTADGNAYDCGSMGVDKALAVFSLVAGIPPWEPPIVCEVQLHELGGKRQWLTLQPDPELIAKRLLGKRSKRS